MSVCAVAVLIHSVLILLEVGCFHESKANKRETQRKLMRLYIICLSGGGGRYISLIGIYFAVSGQFGLVKRENKQKLGMSARGLIVFDRAKRCRPAVWPPRHTDLTGSFGSETPC